VNGACPDGSDPFCPNCTETNIFVGGMKYLDASGEGAFTEGEAPIANVNVTLTNTSTNDSYALSTNEFGMWSRKFTQVVCVGEAAPPAITLTACEDKPLPTNWLQTGPNLDDETGDAFKADASRCWQGTLLSESLSLDFGNVCYGVGGGGYTLGFWHNKNGGKWITNVNGGSTPRTVSCLNGPNGGVLGLPLTNANGTLYSLTGLKDFQSWLVNANATNMANMLSAQLAAMWLNVNCRESASGTALVYAPELVPFNLPGMTSAGLITIQAVIDEAVAELGTRGHNLTTSAGEDSAFRAYQAALKTVLDRGNNNLNWVGNASSCPAPDDWQIVTAQ
jgi:hypothetical protein